MSANVINLRKPRLKELIRNWKSKYEIDGLAGAVMDISLNLQRRRVGSKAVDSGHPYAEVFSVSSFTGSFYYAVNIHCWAFIVDEWRFDEPRDANLRQLLLSPKTIPWDKIRAKPRPTCNGEEFTWYGKLRLDTHYWQKMEGMLLEGLHTRNEPYRSELRKIRLSQRALAKALKVEEREKAAAERIAKAIMSAHQQPTNNTGGRK